MSEFGSQSEEELKEMVNFKSPEQETTIEVEKRKPFDATIVLGAGVGDPLWKKFQEKYPDGSNPRGVDIKDSEGTMLGVDAKMRTIAAAEMYIQGLTSQIIFTGGKTALKRGIDYSEAEVMKKYAGSLLLRAGISDEEIKSAIILEERATNTIENIANICNMIDSKPEEYQHLAILTNEYHLDRAQELIKKFNLQAEGFRAEDLLRKRSDKYDKVVDKFFASEGYQYKLDGEKRWTKGLIEPKYARYWAPQAITVDNSDRIGYIIRSLGLEKVEEEFGRDGVVKAIKESSRIMPKEEKGETEPQLTKIFLARHGESKHNVAEVPYFAGGSLEQDADLTQKGIESANKVAEQLKNEDIDVIVCSDLKRSRQTAEIISQLLSRPVEIAVLQGLREVHVGELTGKTRAEVRESGSEEAKEALDTFISGDIRNINFPGGDNFESASKRVKESLSQILQTYGDKANIALVGHGNINKVMLALMFPENIEFVNNVIVGHENIIEVDTQLDKNGKAQFNNAKLIGEGESKGLI